MCALDRRRFAQLALAAAVSSTLLRSSLAEASDAVSGAAKRVYSRAVVVDGCGGPGGFDPSYDGRSSLPAAMLADVRASGMTAANVTVGAVGNVPNAYEETVAGIAFYEREIERNRDLFMKITRAAHIDEAKSSGRFGLIYGLQDASMLGAEVDRLDILHQLGVRIVQPTYNGRNLLGDGCLEPADAGLSRFGRQVIERINALGALLDLSHCGRRTAADAIAATTAPPAFTHSACHALVDNPRNRTDEEMRAMADKGGVLGVYFMPFLRASGQPTSEDVIRHLEHAIKICGEDHVGVGTDGFVSANELTDDYRKMHREFVEQRRKQGIAAPGEDENVFNFVPDLNTPRRLETLADRLLARGHSEARVEKILGGNFARLFREVWKA